MQIMATKIEASNTTEISFFTFVLPSAFHSAHNNNVENLHLSNGKTNHLHHKKKAAGDSQQP
jgi:hypothetical protein